MIWKLGLVGIAVGVLLGVQPVPAQTPAVHGRPNILFLVSDDLRPEQGCYGNTVALSRVKSGGLVVLAVDFGVKNG